MNQGNTVKELDQAIETMLQETQAQNEKLIALINAVSRHKLLESKLRELVRLKRKATGRKNSRKLEDLRKPLEPGGLLHSGKWIKARDLRDNSIAWRRLIDDLRTPGETKQAAEAALHSLGVVYRPSGRGFEFAAL